jgi:hypothetical protein
VNHPGRKELLLVSVAREDLKGGMWFAEIDRSGDKPTVGEWKWTDEVQGDATNLLPLHAVA